MAEELSIDSLKEMSKADFIKAFKKKTAWKKAKAVIVMVDYKIDGKKTTVAVPFRKEAEMKAEMKRMKKEKTHPLKKSGGGMISFENDGEEGMKAKIELTLGGLKPELLQTKGEDLFGRINTILEVLVADNAELEDAGEAGEEEDEEELDLDLGDGAPNSAGAGLLEELEASIAEIKGTFKDKIQAIVAAIKNKEAKEEFLDVVDDLKNKIVDMKDNLGAAGEKIKTQLAPKVKKVLEYAVQLANIKNALAAIFKKGETPSELPPAVKKFIEDLVAKIKEAKAIKTDPGKFDDIVKVIQAVFNNLTVALEVLNKDLAEKVKDSKAYQFIEDFIESLDDETDEEDYDDDENIENQPNKVSEEEKKEFEGTVKELETLFSAIGIQL